MTALTGARCTQRTIDSPIGPLSVVVDGDAVVAIGFEAAVPQAWADARPVPRGEVVVLDRAEDQLREYFAGTRRDFDLPLAPSGTEFQQAAWKALTAIPYGETRTYGEQAVAIGRPSAVRAIGAANGANPIPVVVPCHRVIGASGELTGFRGGIDTKRFLLDLESGDRENRLL